MIGIFITGVIAIAITIIGTIHGPLTLIGIIITILIVHITLFMALKQKLLIIIPGYLT
jgi:hypothetical protein